MKKRKRRSDRSGRVSLRSPGRPPSAQREDHRRFWAAIAMGQSSEDAASLAGVSPAVGGRWFREAGGMPPARFASSAKLPSKRYLQLSEREEIALQRAQGLGVREIARQLERAASTISRELRRNAAPDRAGWSIGQRPRNSMPIAPLAGPSRPSWWSIQLCATMCRSVCPARWLLRTAWRSQAGCALECASSRAPAGPAVGQGVGP